MVEKLSIKNPCVLFSILGNRILSKTKMHFRL